MTPKAKAKELFDKYFPYAYPFSAGSGFLTGDRDEESQKRDCIKITSICVDELINDSGNDDGKNYWIAVKQELEKL